MLHEFVAGTKSRGFYYMSLLQVVKSEGVCYMSLLQVVKSGGVCYMSLLQVVKSERVCYMSLLQVVKSEGVCYMSLLQVVNNDFNNNNFKCLLLYVKNSKSICLQMLKCCYLWRISWTYHLYGKILKLLAIINYLTNLINY